jgi:hypothetical protein
VTWLRSKARGLSVLALLALALQFGVTWGHFHSDGLFKPVVTTLAFQADPSATNPGHAQDADHDLCAICITIAMVASAVDAVPPPLPLPSSFTLRAEGIDGNAVALAQRRALFQSRAPPAV